MVMSGPTRMALHAVSRVIRNSIPQELLDYFEYLNEENSENSWSYIREYMRESSINKFFLTQYIMNVYFIPPINFCFF